jgi:hypothetical protein
MMGVLGWLRRLLRAAPDHKVGRNEPCPCGSGKKFKHCCLSKTEHNVLLPNEPALPSGWTNRVFDKINRYRTPKP